MQHNQASETKEAQTNFRRLLITNNQAAEAAEPSQGAFHVPPTPKLPFKIVPRSLHGRLRQSALTQAGVRLIPTIFHYSTAESIALQIVG